MDAPLRLTPTMSSRKAAAITFIRTYITRHGISPCYAEIAEGIGTNKERVKDIVRRLAAEGRIIREPGVTRGIRFPTTIEEAKRDLIAAGWTFDQALGFLRPPSTGVTETTLLEPPVLDYLPSVGIGGSQNGTDGC